MDMITKVEIEGFKSIRKAEIELRPLNVMIGANGSGKSNFLSLLGYASLAEQRKDTKEETIRQGGADAILYYGKRISNVLRFRIYRLLADKQYALDAVLSPGAGDDFSGRFSRKSLDQRVPWPAPEVEMPSLLDGLDIYHFQDTSAVARVMSHKNIDDNYEIKRDGATLAPFLFRLGKTHADAYKRIVDTVQLCLPYFGDFSLAPNPHNEKTIIFKWREKGWDLDLYASQLSDGALRFIALTTLLMQPPELMPKLIVIDEPELGLHPHALILLAGMIQRASRHVQVIVATQSPALISHFGPEDIIVCERLREPGADRFESSFYRLDTTMLKDWLEEYSLGEMLERNLFYPPPEPEAMGR